MYLGPIERDDASSFGMECLWTCLLPSLKAQNTARMASLHGSFQRLWCGRKMYGRVSVKRNIWCAVSHLSLLCSSQKRQFLFICYTNSDEQLYLALDPAGWTPPTRDRTLSTSVRKRAKWPSADNAIATIFGGY